MIMAREMKSARLLRRAVVVVLLGVALASCAHGRDVMPLTARRFQIDWQVTRDAHGAIVRGRIANPYAVPARDIQLLVEGLDADGAVVTATTSAVRRLVLSGDRAPFDVLVPGAADHYRVSVIAFDLVLPRGGR